MSVILPVTFDECEVTHIVTPEIDDVIFNYGDSPIEIVYDPFISNDDPECNYYWEYTIQSTSNLFNAIVADFYANTIIIGPEAGED